MSPAARRCLRAVAAVAVVIVFLTGAVPAAAHGFSSTVYVDLTSPATGHVRAEIGLEYDLLVVSTADYESDDQLFRTGHAAFQAGDTAAQADTLNSHAGSVLAYVTGRFAVSAAGRTCAPAPVGDLTIEQREGVPYALLVLDYACPGSATAHDVHSGVFPDSEGYVRDTKTIVSYHLDLRTGSAALDAAHPSFSTNQSWTERYWEFFRLGTEHLLTGFDHILFLLALIVGSRRLREMVLAATTFTLAHSVTFALAALGVVHVSSSVVEPAIALSIVGVAGWHLWRIRQRGSQASNLGTLHHRHLSLDAAGWARLAIVFCFGLIHGLGFASALGIQQAWSWTLLWSLLVFNVGIECAQLAIIAATFPLLVVLRRRQPRAALWTTGAVAAGVSVMGLVWFVQRILQI